MPLKDDWRSASAAIRLPSMRFWTILRRSMLLRCPLCGRGALFRHLLSMHERCGHCGVKFEREPGFFLGSIYINYGVTSLAVAIAYPILLFNKIVPETPLLIGSLAFVVIGSLLMFPHARSLWLGFDQWRDPREGETGTDGESKGERGASA